MIILGIDPGYGILGWSVIEKNMRLLDYGVIETKSHLSIEDRIFIIHHELKRIIELYKPECGSIEKIFFQKNTKTAIDVAKTVGAIVLTLKMHNLDCFEYTPSQVKQALTGFGRATKEQMQFMVKKIFNIKEIPKPDDAADAIAIAACHSFKQVL